VPPVALEPEGKRLSRAEFQGLGEMPPELEWFARPRQPPHPAEPTVSGVRDFTAFAGVERPEEMRQITRAHRNRLALKTSSAGA
jgi:integrase/recombinase XerD